MLGSISGPYHTIDTGPHEVDSSCLLHALSGIESLLYSDPHVQFALYTCFCLRWIECAQQRIFHLLMRTVLGDYLQSLASSLLH